nr:unnamed protein product [Callosobruchus chinensis]
MFTSNSLKQVYKNSGYKCIEIFIDLSKAFDSRLIRGHPLHWFCNYLCGRKQYVQIEDSQSSRTVNDIGVPQGSILGSGTFAIHNLCERL